MTITNLILAAYPVGSIYMSVNSTSPATLFGGTWERITGKFLLAATDNGSTGTNVQSTASAAPGASGGEAAHKLTATETATKSHSHTYTKANATTESKSHSHPLSSNGGAALAAWGADIYFREQNNVINAWSTNYKVTASSGGSDSGSKNTRWSVALGGNTDSASHNHDIKTTTPSTTGNPSDADASSSHNNMPPFLSVYVWKRTA